jgi:hypothetical protein
MAGSTNRGFTVCMYMHVQLDQPIYLFLTKIDPTKNTP